MFIIKLREANGALTHKEQLIAKYLINYHQYDYSALTSSNLAEELNIAQATIIRFSQKLGYSSFKDMVLDIKESASLNFEDSDIAQNEPEAETIEKLRALYINSINETVKLNSPDQIAKAALAIASARTVLCFGARSSACIAFIMRNRLAEIGINAVGTEDDFLSKSISRNLGKEDILFIVSASGESPKSVKVALMAHENGCRIVSITGNHQNTIRDLADYPLLLPEHAMFTKIFSLTNKCPQIFLIDSMFLTIWKKNKDYYMKKIPEINPLLPISEKQSKYDLYRL